MDTTSPLTHRSLVAGAVLSALSVLAVLLLVLAPSLPLPRPEPVTSFLLAITSPALTAGAVLATGGLGVLSAVLALADRAPRPLLVAAAAAHVLVIGVGLSSMSTLMVAGYLTALVVPLVAVLLLVQGLRRPGPGRIVAAVLSLALLAALGLGRHVLRDLAVDLGPAMLAAVPDMLLALLPVLVAAGWAMIGVLVLRGTPAAERATAWVTAHRRSLTLLAAAGPLPYVALRATWFTPWPLLAPAGVDLDPDMRLWGLLLGGGGLLGSVLTLLLITPWAQVFPGWMPGVAGRRVPVSAVLVPGGLVAALLCVAAVPMLHSSVLVGHALEFTLVFPLWLWGPALALAVWGYVGQRRADARQDAAAQERMAA